MNTPSTAEVAVLGRQRPYVLDTLGADFVLHRFNGVESALAKLGPVAERVRGVVSNPMVGLPAAVIDAMPRLEVAAFIGVGLERVDLKVAQERGIVVTTTPVLYEDVADLAVLLAMAASRRAVEGDRWVRDERWLAGPMDLGWRFSLKRAGILGMGRIGRMLASRLSAFGMTIGYHDPKPMPDLGYRSFDSAAELARESDFLFLCAAGAPGVRNIVTADVLAELGPDGVFVNVARGWLVDEAALVDALTSGKIRAAGLDVFASEPEVPVALREVGNVVLTPHIASATVETRQAMDECLIDNVRSWFSGKGAVTPVT